MDNQGIRVNRISVNVNKRTNYTTISFYKTNELLGSFTEEQLGLPFVKDVIDDVSLNAYIAYCRDYAVRLLNAGAIDGYYYDPKSEGQSIRYGDIDFKNGTQEYVKNLIGDKYKYTFPMTERIKVSERYENKYIKNASIELDVDIDDKRITVINEIRSGQLCRPKTFKYSEIEYPFNITNVNKVLKD